MKKILAFLGVAAATATMVFANAEINLRFFGDFMSVKAEETAAYDSYEVAKLSTEAKISTFGLELETNFWFVHPWILDIGLSTGFDFGFGPFTTEYEAKLLGRTVYNDDSVNPAVAAALSIAPAVQFNVGQYNSFFVSPGFRFPIGFVFDATYGIEEREDEDNVEKYYSTNGFFFIIPEFALNLGYKLWFSKHVGLNIGYQLEVPLSVIFDDEKADYDSAIANRFYLGFAFNIGKRYYGTGMND